MKQLYHPQAYFHYKGTYWIVISNPYQVVERIKIRAYYPFERTNKERGGIYKNLSDSNYAKQKYTKR